MSTPVQNPDPNTFKPEVQFYRKWGLVKFIIWNFCVLFIGFVLTKVFDEIYETQKNTIEFKRTIEDLDSEYLIKGVTVKPYGQKEGHTDENGEILLDIDKAKAINNIFVIEYEMSKYCPRRETIDFSGAIKLDTKIFLETNKNNNCNE